MMKKILLIISMIAMGGLFYSGVKSFFHNPRTQDEITQNKKSAKMYERSENNQSQSDSNPKTASLLENFKQFIANPVNTDNNDRETRQTLKTSDEENEIAGQIQNYFNKAAEVTFPTDKDLQNALTEFVINNNSKPLRNVIEGFKMANVKLYNMDTPAEVRDIHNNSVWIINELINVLETISQAKLQEKINKIIDKEALTEIKQKTAETRTKIQSLKIKYNLDIVL